MSFQLLPKCGSARRSALATNDLAAGRSGVGVGVGVGHWKRPLGESAAEVTNSLTTIIHALISLWGGILVVSHTQHDIIRAVSNATDVFCYHSLGYYIFDSCCLYNIYSKGREKASLQTLKGFVRYHTLDVIHHLAFIYIYAPIVLVFRNGLGDLVVGVTLTMHASTPFVAVRNLLNLLHFGRNTLIYLANSVLMLVTFFLCRIFSLPMVYWLYARQSGTSLLEAASHLHWYCLLFSFLLIFFQSFWCYKMLLIVTKTARRVLMKSSGQHVNSLTPCRSNVQS